MLKRAFDLIVAALALLLLAPLLFALALMVRLDSPGPALFRQERMGRGFRPFRICKFRTMTSGATARICCRSRWSLRSRLRLPAADARSARGTSKLPRMGGSGPRLTVAGDVRITRLGRWLRRWHWDELPQLINVLRGEMSLVGPRPEVPEYVRQFAAEYAELLRVRPGLTDPASLQFRQEAELLARQPDPQAYYRAVLLPAKLHLSREYLRTATLWKDLWILCKTILQAGRAPLPEPERIPEAR